MQRSGGRWWHDRTVTIGTREVVICIAVVDAIFYFLIAVWGAYDLQMARVVAFMLSLEANVGLLAYAAHEIYQGRG